MTKLPIIFTIACVFAVGAAFGGGFPGSNDNQFRPPPKSRKHIDFTPRGFLIEGKPVFVTAAEVQYPRIPRALWRDRLLRVKRAGYNTIQTYAYWSFHEPRHGQWDFQGDHDFRAFLNLAHSLGMYAIVRVGPYVNAEWDSGGLPIWLRFVPGMVDRKPNAPFEAAVDEWFGKIIPIVASEQITRGGPVIMVQLENEHPDGAGTDLPNDYFKHLRDKAVSLGIDVPYFFSGLNHGNDPIGDSPIDPDTRQSPWYSSEFWTGWIATYGVDPDRARRLVRATWKIIALGGAGFSQYTLVGGTDFDHWACDVQASAYDFGAPIGQQGDFRQDYAPLKRAIYFADSFTDILASSQNASADFAKSAAGDPVSIYARKSPTGTIVFFDNRGDGTAKAQFHDIDGTLVPNGGPMTLDPGEIVPIVKDRPLPCGATLKIAAVRLLGVATYGKTTTLVAYGHPGEPAEMRFDLGLGANVPPWRVDESIPKSGIDEVNAPAGKGRLRVLLMTTAEADRTWFVDRPEGQLVVFGPDYLGDWPDTMHTEYNAGSTDIPDNVIVYGNGLPTRYAAVANPAASRPYAVPALSPWQWAPGAAEAAAGFEDRWWMASKSPQPMGADGDTSEYAWYRTTVNSAGGPFALNFSDAGDWLAVFVNGKLAGSTEVVTRYQNPAPRSVMVNLKPGRNEIAVLAAHYGRNKLYDWYGPLDDIDSKGIRGDVVLSDHASTATSITTWRWKEDDRGEASAGEESTADAKAPGWQDASIGQDVFHGHVGYAWFRTTLSSQDGAGAGAHRTLHFVSVDDNAEVYLNGKKLASNTGWNVPFDVDLDSAWNPSGPNELAVLNQNTTQGGGIMGPVTLSVIFPAIAPPITGWKMRGDITMPGSWSDSAATGQTGPKFYRSSFTIDPNLDNGRRIALRLSTAGLSRGFVWFNGHNMGRYPEKSPVDGIYLPECWQKVGKNSLVIFDEDGNSPASVKIYEETQASRRVVEYKKEK